MAYTPPAPPTQKIGQAGGFGGTSSFLGKQNLPGQSVSLGGPSSQAVMALSQPSAAQYGTTDSGIMGNYVNPGGFTQSQGPQTVQTGGSVQGNVYSPNNGGNPFTSPHLFDAATMRALNSGEMLFGGSQGPVSLKGMLDAQMSRAGGGAGLPGQNYQSYLDSLKQQGDGPQLMSIAQTAGPNQAANADSLRTLSEAQMPSQSTDTGNRGWSPNDQGLNSGNTNAQNWAAGQVMNPGLREPTSGAGFPTGAAQGAYSTGGYGGPLSNAGGIGGSYQPGGAYSYLPPPNAGNSQNAGYPSGTYPNSGGGYPQGGGQGAYPRFNTSGVPPGYESPAFDLEQQLQAINDPYNQKNNNVFNKYGNKEQQQAFWNRANFSAIAPVYSEASGLLPLGFGPGNFQYGRTSDALDTLGGPLFGGAATGIATDEGGASLGAASNLRLAQMLEGGARGQQREDMLQYLTDRSLGSTQAAGAEQLAQNAMQLSDPAMLDQRYADLERQVREQNAMGVTNAQNRLQDLGIASQGMGQSPALLAAQNNGNRGLQDSLLQLSQMKQQERLANLAASGQAFGQSAGLYGQFNEQPFLRQIGALQGPQNMAVDPFANQLERNAQIAQGVSLAGQNQSNLPGILSLAGGAVGGILGGAYGGGAPGAAAGFSIGSAGGNALGNVFNK